MRCSTSRPDMKGMGDWLWSHEYTKHGTCATRVTHNEHDYFKAALDLREKIDYLVGCSRLYNNGHDHFID